MHTVYPWRHTDSRSGRRIKTRYRLSEDDARQRLIDPERIDASAEAVEPVTTTLGGHQRSGLVQREDGALVASESGIE